MNEIERALRELIGLDGASIGSSQIQRCVRLRMKNLGLRRPQEYRDFLQSSPAEWDELVESVVVTETWFFRDSEPFTSVLGLVEQWLSANPVGRVRLLSLPCSSGEEPYSLVMKLLDAGISAGRFEIDAVDISAAALTRAQRGIYGKNSFRGKDLDFRNRHFNELGEGFAISREVRNCVRFSQGNLLADNFRTPNAVYDVIFCRNLLIYFDRATQQKAVTKIGGLLAPEGVLFVGAAEQPLVLYHGFVSAHLAMAFACRKATAKAAFVKRELRVETASTPEQPSKSVSANGHSQAHRLPPNTAHADLEVARRLADEGRLAEAAKICQAHLAENERSAQAYFLWGLVRDAAGDPSAPECYRKALYLEPNHYESLMHLALWLEKNGERANARRLKSRAQRVKTGS